jgi:hypothetical protein
MRKFALAAVMTMAVAGFALAEEFTMTVTAIGEDGSLTGTKGGGFGKGGKGGKGGKAEEVTIKVSKDAKVFKGKFDMDSKGFVPDGDDLKAAGLKSAFQAAQNGTVSVAGKALTGSDTLELSIKDGKPAAKLNGKEVPFTDVAVKGKQNLSVRVTTADDGSATQVLITPGFGGGFGGKGGKGGGGGAGGAKAGGGN